MIIDQTHSIRLKKQKLNRYSHDEILGNGKKIYSSVLLSGLFELFSSKECGNHRYEIPHNIYRKPIIADNILNLINF